jgi:hypothetical protein
VTHVPEPELGLFKAGYGGWRLQDWDAPLTRPGAVIELRPLRSPDERRKYLEGAWTREERAQLRPGWHSAGPPPNWIDLLYREARGFEVAINRERAALGLRPIGIGYPQLWTKYLQPAPPAGAFGGLRFEDFDGVFDPTGVAVPDTGEIVVHACALHTFTPRGWRLDPRRLPFPIDPHCGIAVDAAGHLYVVGDRDRRVHQVDAAGRVLASFGEGRGEGDGQLFEPMGLAVDAAGRVWVADWLRGQGRVHGFAPDGTLLGTWRVGDDGQRLRSPQGLAVDGQGRIQVADRDLPGLVPITPFRIR